MLTKIVSHSYKFKKHENNSYNKYFDNCVVAYELQ